MWWLNTCKEFVRWGWGDLGKMFKAHRGSSWSIAAFEVLALAVTKESSLFSWPPCPLTKAIRIMCCFNSHLWPWPPHQGIWCCDSCNIKSLTRRNEHQSYQSQFHANWKKATRGNVRPCKGDRQGSWWYSHPTSQGSQEGAKPSYLWLPESFPVIYGGLVHNPS